MKLVINVIRVFTWLPICYAWQLAKKKILVPLFQSMTSTPKTKHTLCCLCMGFFSCTLSKLQLVARNSDWFIPLFAPLVFGRSNYFCISYSTVIWKSQKKMVWHLNLHGNFVTLSLHLMKHILRHKWLWLLDFSTVYTLPWEEKVTKQVHQMYEAARQEIIRLMHLSRTPIQNQSHPKELINMISGLMTYKMQKMEGKNMLTSGKFFPWMKTWSTKEKWLQNKYGAKSVSSPINWLKNKLVSLFSVSLLCSAVY